MEDSRALPGRESNHPLTVAAPMPSLTHETPLTHETSFTHETPHQSRDR
jgi:hypothetical protein